MSATPGRTFTGAGKDCPACSVAGLCTATLGRNCDNQPQVLTRVLIPALLVFQLYGQTASDRVLPRQTAADLGRAVRTVGLDPAECYRVHDIEFSQEDMRFYLTSGYLIFGKPVNGKPVSAVFSTDTDGGDAEVLLLPPDKSERRSLALHTGTPNLDEHFRTGVFLFTDATVRELLEQVRTSASARKTPEIGALLADQFNVTVSNIAASFESRMVFDLLNARDQSRGFFGALIQGQKLGNFDLIADPRSYEQINGGQMTSKNGRAFWDTWTSFSTKARRSQPPPPAEERILGYHIDATLDASLTLHCVTRIRIETTDDSRNVIPFDFSGRMIAKSAKVDGVPAEVYMRDSVRNGLVQNTGNELLLVIPPTPLAPGTVHEIEITHEGLIAADTGHQVYFIGARGNWYPSRGAQFASFDATWRYPKTLSLVSAGPIKEDRTEGETRITRRVPDSPIRMLGFNMGQYDHKSLDQAGIHLEVSANHEVEDSLRPRVALPLETDHVFDAATSVGIVNRRGPRTAPGPPQIMPSVPLPPEPIPVARPSDQLGRIAADIGAALEFYQARFGAPPLNHIEVSPVPGRFGQGFPGMIYLSTLTYLPASSRPIAGMRSYEQLFFGEMLSAHEAAHQWWGNIVTSGSYHHEWLMEALANYSAMMFLESRKGPKFIDGVLDEYRRELLTKGPNGEPVDSAGPVVQGARLDSTEVPGAWTSIVYGKGTWIIHMLRRRLGDARFARMLTEIRKRYENKTINTEEFRILCAEFLPPSSPDSKLEEFFDIWVYGTGIPNLKMNFTVQGKPGAYKLTGTVTQTDAPEDFSILVPVEIQTVKGKVVKMVRTSSEPVPFSVDVPSNAARAVLDPGLSVLRR